jgi:hypothetical protein
LFNKILKLWMIYLCCDIDKMDPPAYLQRHLGAGIQY